MSPGTRCDEILRMIDEVLAEATLGEPQADDAVLDGATGEARDRPLVGAACPKG